ncbi:uncharacterized protein LOC124288022 [Haliotis rubra]|uniref:uncharacterized protein LOC124280145 n=1 Tax=Haliotis rubra TaxID=36100 RepID=UPI001EE5A060|nr:uncharacterized protein LOC124280145 [Haliotis rubra]XP_046580506.1 uncharacterized protein LOC124288022 [Haliotis rubra]
MKCAIIILVLLPLAYCNILDQFTYLFDVGELKAIVQKLFDTVGSDGTVAACEGECTVLIHQNALLSSGCDLVCRSLQSLVKRFHIA